MSFQNLGWTSCGGDCSRAFPSTSTSPSTSPSTEAIDEADESYQGKENIKMFLHCPCLVALAKRKKG